jgi:hypothetical protein
VKILRKHSGFTTNSSGSSEWVPPETDPALEQESGTLQQGIPDFISNLPAWSKPLIGIGLVAFIVAGFFFLERLVRLIWKKIKRAKSEEN